MDQVDNGDQPGYSPGLLKSWSDRGFPPSTTLANQVGKHDSLGCFEQLKLAATGRHTAVDCCCSSVLVGSTQRGPKRGSI